MAAPFLRKSRLRVAERQRFPRTDLGIVLGIEKQDQVFAGIVGQAGRSALRGLAVRNAGRRSPGCRGCVTISP